MADRVEEKQASNVTNEQIAAASVEISRSKRAKDEAVGNHRAVLKRHKAEGVPIQALLDALGLKQMDNDDARKKMRDLLRCALVIAPDLPLRQDDLFDRNADFDIAERAGLQLNEWEAEEQGYAAGLHGGSVDDCTFATGTPFHVKFREGFFRGQAVIAARMGENAGASKVASIGRRKPRADDDATSQVA